MSNYKYIVWVGGCDDYFATYYRAKKHYDEWIDKGYEDVQIEEITSVSTESPLPYSPINVLTW